MTYGFSRDDAGKFLDAYYDVKIFENDPFAKIDQGGVGKLMQMAVKLGRGVRENMHCGICGEHGGDPSSIEFCHKIGLSYVSCSPFRVPIARLAAAQAQIEDTIDALEPTERRLARFRYIDGLTWEKVCDRMCYSWMQTHRIHGRMLDKLVNAELIKRSTE
jgi:hypothetical protein